MAKRIQRSSARPAAAASRRSGQPTGRRPRRGRVKGGLVTDFTVQLATLSEAGIPVVKALTILEGQLPPGPFKGVLAELKEEQFRLRFKSSMMELENPSLLRNIRKDIARLKTILRERELAQNG